MRSVLGIRGAVETLAVTSNDGFDALSRGSASLCEVRTPVADVSLEIPDTDRVLEMCAVPPASRALGGRPPMTVDDVIDRLHALKTVYPSVGQASVVAGKTIGFGADFVRVIDGGRVVVLALNDESGGRR